MLAAPGGQVQDDITMHGSALVAQYDPRPHDYASTGGAQPQHTSLLNGTFARDNSRDRLR